ncbi:hypothetical protein NQZ68_008443 [Dissostichus eleginoides]|nr:hypothetical protein NQZ68_008443 [Dissostichus eleginoides]
MSSVNSHPSAVSRRREDYRLRVFAARSKRRQQHRARGGGEENIVILLHEDISPAFSPGECEWISIQSERGCL